MSITFASLSTFLIAILFIVLYVWFCILDGILCYMLFSHIILLTCMEFSPPHQYILISNNFMKIWNIEWDFFDQFNRKSQGGNVAPTIQKRYWFFSISHDVTYILNLKKSYYGNLTLLYRFLLWANFVHQSKSNISSK